MHISETKSSVPVPQDLINEFFAMNLIEVQGLNLLSRHHIISDHVVFANDIATTDLIRAIEFLKP